MVLSQNGKESYHETHWRLFSDLAGTGECGSWGVAGFTAAEAAGKSATHMKAS